MRDNFDLNEPNMTTILEDRELGCPPVAVIAATGIESTEESMSQNRVENSQNNTNQAEGKKSLNHSFRFFMVIRGQNFEKGQNTEE